MRPCFACFASASGSRSRRSSVATLRSCRRCAWPRASWSVALLDVSLLIDRSAEPVAVELLAPPVFVLSPFKHYRRRVRSPLTKPIARPPCPRSCPSSELLTLSCSCRLDALVRLTELTALMPASGRSRATCASSCRLTATLRPPFQRTPFTTVDPCRHSDCSTLLHTAQIPAETVVA